MLCLKGDKAALLLMNTLRSKLRTRGINQEQSSVAGCMSNFAFNIERKVVTFLPSIKG